MFPARFCAFEDLADIQATASSKNDPERASQINGAAHKATLLSQPDLVLSKSFPECFGQAGVNRFGWIMGSNAQAGRRFA
ncbi:MAG: hypothetical protein QOC84_1349 [Bradyrhizobium sp.]|nr:hypothetical protein [Bradyrhizobium sp.]